MPKSINENANRKNRIKLTKRSVEVPPNATTSSIWYDDKLAGFGVRVMPGGRRFYSARYRNKHGRSRWFTIVEHGKVTADAARTKAQRVLQTVAVDGSDTSGRVQVPPSRPSSAFGANLNEDGASSFNRAGSENIARISDGR